MRRARTALLFAGSGLVVGGAAFAYVAGTGLRLSPIALLSSVLLLVLIVVSGTIFGRSGKGGVEPAPHSLHPGARPVLLAGLVFVSAFGVVRLSRVLVASERGPSSASTAAARADSVLLEVREQGVGPALALLRERVQLDPELLVQSHHVAHEAGRIAVESADFDPSVLSECPLDFAAGCFHGVLEHYFFAHPSMDDALIPSFCADLLGHPGLVARTLECSHGLGHGLAVRWDHDAAAATRDCDLLGSQIERGECAEGVFMEVMTYALGAGHPGSASHDHGMPVQPALDHGHVAADGTVVEVHAASHVSAPVSHADAHATASDTACGAAVERYQAACWAYEYLVIRAASGGSWERTAEGCLQAGRLELIDACVSGVGSQIALEHFGDWDTVYKLCQGLPQSAPGSCIAGAVEHLLDFDWSSERAFGFCANAPATLASICYATAGSRIAVLTTDPEPEMLCRPAPEEFQAACGLGVERTGKLRAAG